MKGMCWQAGGGNLAGRQMAASERPSKWEQAGALADKQKSGAQGLGSRKQEMFTKSRKAALPPCPGDAVLLPQDTIRESGPGRWIQVLRKSGFDSKNLSPREIPLVPSLKSFNIKIRNVCSVQIQGDLKFWAEEFVPHSEARTATEGFNVSRRTTEEIYNRSFQSDLDLKACFNNLLVMWWWANDLTSKSLSFLICVLSLKVVMSIMEGVSGLNLAGVTLSLTVETESVEPLSHQRWAKSFCSPLAVPLGIILMKSNGKHYF